MKTLISKVYVSNNEIKIANNLNKNNYKCYFQNKYSDKNILDNKKFISIIIDINLKSYACCDLAFIKLIEI